MFGCTKSSLLNGLSLGMASRGRLFSSSVQASRCGGFIFSAPRLQIEGSVVVAPMWLTWDV